tara:strand:- start:4077 stop:5093 length:1017 start_codon:yes stop_codon:yes gene_type:complete
MREDFHYDEIASHLFELSNRLGQYLNNYGHIILVIIVTMPIWFSRKLLINGLTKKGQANSKIKQIKRTTFYFCSFISLIIFTPFWLDGFREFGTIFGLITAAVAIALSQPLQSLTAGIFLIIKRPYVIGDRIEINGKSGEVSDITILYTTLLEIDTSESSGQFTGKLLQIQNRHLFTSTIVNFSTMFGMTWEEISFTITYESNWKKTQRELAYIVRSTVYDFSIEAEAHISKNRHDFPLMSTNPTFHISPTDYGINIAARFLCPSISARCTKDKIWSQILVLIENLEQIELAYPTKRVIEEKGEVNSIQLEPINDAQRPAIPPKIPEASSSNVLFPVQ